MRKNGDVLQRVTVFVAGVALSIGAALCSCMDNGGLVVPSSPQPPETPTIATETSASPVAVNTPATATTTQTAPAASATRFILPTSTTLPTPSPITSTNTIIEVTPLGGQQETYLSHAWAGLPTGTYYVPIVNLVVRSADPDHPPSTNDSANPKTGLVKYANSIVYVHTIYSDFISGDRWLCIDEPDGDIDKEYWCKNVIAYIVGGSPKGILWYP